MNKANILASQKYILANSDKVVKEYHFAQLEYGKLLAPIKLRIKKPHKDSREIAVQFFDSPNWTNCINHELSKRPLTYSYLSKRKFKKWSIPVEIRMADNGESLQLIIFKKEVQSKLSNNV
ncbi:hypothetical protein PY092_06305 [Muricauda sp. 334s03]|uniref:Uncharacterized protein n=1 Tax=Flagellimonas yonaguniensis TaxID=3031325 RepID=A0ABT5XY50_9FLAO|nr:hypothetical protein [[Muricauda] yonaguniensis]MDF0715752.1 hypothetical protein [[Muricauda] yonaguniensis]